MFHVQTLADSLGVFLTFSVKIAVWMASSSSKSSLYLENGKENILIYYFKNYCNLNSKTGLRVPHSQEIHFAKKSLCRMTFLKKTMEFHEEFDRERGIKTYYSKSQKT